MDTVRVLLVDDDDLIRRTWERLLELEGFSVATERDGVAAVSRADLASFDVVLSDVAMPQMDGVALLRALRGEGIDAPVVLVTGSSHEAFAEEAVRLGAMLYLHKPVDSRTLVDVLRHAGHIGSLARLKREALALLGQNAQQPSDLASLEVQFERAVAGLWVALQPIVIPTERRVIAYEALMRSREPSLPHPGALLDAAERLGRVEALGSAVRARVADAVPGLPPEVDVYVNLHPRDLACEAFLSGHEPLAAYAERVVLEVTERASLDALGPLDVVTTRLREQGYRVAVDDLGAGYAGLTAITQLKPEVVKIDMSLVRGLDADDVRRELVARIAEACRKLGLRVVCEGVETAAERDALLEVQCDCQQGYLYAKPAFPPPEVRWT